MAELQDQMLWCGEDEKNPGQFAECHYLSTGEFEVKITKDGNVLASEKFPAQHEPRFGIDVADWETIYDAAAKLSDQVKAQQESKDVS